MKYIIFSLGSKQYALGVDSVFEIMSEPEVTEIPQCPKFISGLIRLRGHSILLVNLKERLGLGAGEKQPKHVIVVKMKGWVVAIQVDYVEDVRDFKESQIDLTETLTGDLSFGEHIAHGVIRDNEKSIILLDMEKLLTQEECQALENQGGSAGDTGQ